MRTPLCSLLLLVLIGILSLVSALSMAQNVIVHFPDGFDTLDQQVGLLFLPRCDVLDVDLDKELDYVRTMHSMSKVEFGDYLMRRAEEKLASLRSSENERDRRFASLCIASLPSFEGKRHLSRVRTLFEDTSLPTRFREGILDSYFTITAGSDEFFSMAEQMMDNSFEDADFSLGVRLKVLGSMNSLVSSVELSAEAKEKAVAFLKRHLESTQWAGGWRSMDSMLCHLDSNYATSDFRKVQARRIESSPPPSPFPVQKAPLGSIPVQMEEAYVDSMLKLMDEIFPASDDRLSNIKDKCLDAISVRLTEETTPLEYHLQARKLLEKHLPKEQDAARIQKMTNMLGLIKEEPHVPIGESIGGTIQPTPQSTPPSPVNMLEQR